MNTCLICKKKVENTFSEKWQSSWGKLFSVEKSNLLYALIVMNGVDACICEDCYKENRWRDICNIDAPELHYQFALEYRDKGLYGDALAALNSIDVSSRGADIWAAFGYIYGKMGKKEMELYSYEEALKKDPLHANSIENIETIKKEVN